MTTATMATHGGTTDPQTMGRRPSLEELLDRVFAALFKEEPETAEQSATRMVHQARRLRQSGDIDGALAVLSGVDMARQHRGRSGGPTLSGWTWRSDGSETWALWSTARARDGPQFLFPGATGCLRRPRSWGCDGRLASWSPSAACGACDPWKRADRLTAAEPESFRWRRLCCT